MMVGLVDQWTIESQEIWRVENRSHGDNDRNPVEKLIGRNRWNHPRLEALTDGCPLAKEKPFTKLCFIIADADLPRVVL